MLQDFRDWAWVRVSFGDSDTYDLMIDPLSGALSGYAMIVRGQKYLSLFGDWRSVDGLRMPYWWVMQTPTEGTTNLVMSEVEVNRSFPAALFNRPASPRKASFADGRHSTGWIDFNLVDGKQIHFPISVNGHEADAWLDNGATPSAIDSSFASFIGLSALSGQIDIKSSGSSPLKGSLVPGATVKIADLSLNNLTVQSIDLTPFGKLAGHPISFMLGEDAFAELVVDIDFPNHRLSFSDPMRFSPPAGAVVIPLVREGINRAIEISIEDKPAIRVLLDLGMNGMLDVFPNYAQAEGLLNDRQRGSTLTSGADGNPEEEVAIVFKTITLGKSVLENVPATVPLKVVQGRYPDDLQGYLGVDILNRYRTILDYSHDRLYLIPDRAALNLPFMRDHIGAILLPDGENAMLVKLVSIGGPASKSGLKLGDKVVRIGGKPANKQAYDEASWLPVGTIVELMLESGEIKSVTLEEYY